MNDKNALCWLAYNIEYYCSIIISRIFKTKITPRLNRTLISREKVSDRIYRAIIEKEPFMVGRSGAFEGIITGENAGKKLHLIKKFKKSSLNFLFFNAGVFPQTERAAERFAEEMESALKKVDIYGYFFFHYSNYLAERLCSEKTIFTQLGDIEPFQLQKPWTMALKGKKVVVVHPFQDTIEAQYKRRKLVFPDGKILPDFDLRVVKAVQTIAGTKDERFATWNDALEYMYQEVIREDFDVAIIGCGAYGFPLAAKIKEYGKIAIHLGGATQLLFGIMGDRWKNQDYVKKMENSYWVRPSDAEKPKNAEKIEQGCYW